MQISSLLLPVLRRLASKRSAGWCDDDSLEMVFQQQQKFRCYNRRSYTNLIAGSFHHHRIGVMAFLCTIEWKQPRVPDTPCSREDDPLPILKAERTFLKP